jgi:RND family efflux transporter MFP subunit
MGILSQVLVKDGDEVKAGQLLANLNEDVLSASLQVAKSAMSAMGELDSAETQLKLKQVEAKKLTDLFGRKHASQQELDRVAGEVQIAAARVLSVKEDLAVRKLEYARIEAQIKQRQIRSTIDGVVVDVRKDEGEFVSPSDPIVARVVQLDPLLVVFSVPNANRSILRKNQIVSMKIAGSGIADGTVEHISPTADASSGTFKVKVRLPNPGRRWHGGEKSELLLNSGNFPKQIARNSK